KTDRPAGIHANAPISGRFAVRAPSPARPPAVRTRFDPQEPSMSRPYHADTIAAIATPPGQGGVGIVRVSGPAALQVAQRISGITPRPRHAHYGAFTAAGQVLDQGLTLYFPGPHSFTGEDVLVLHGQGGPVVMDMLLKACLDCGVRLVRPGEFSERGFPTDELDMAQAAALADLIEDSSEQADRKAVPSLQAAFSQRAQAI